MPGRPPHITDETFAEFFESIPEEARHRGYWTVRHETFGRAGGLVQANIGRLDVEPNETYDSLRERVKERFAKKRGPGTYYVTACDQNKKEIRGPGIAKFIFDEKEIEMPEPAPQDPTAPVREVVNTVKKVSKDMNDLQTIEFTKRLMEKFLGGGKEKEVEVKEGLSPSMNDLFVWKSIMDDTGRKKESSVDPIIAQQLADLKLERTVSEKIDKAMNEVKSLLQAPREDRFEKLLEKLIDLQKPKEDSKLERLLEKLIELQSQPKEDKFEKILERIFSKEEEARREQIRREERAREEARAAEERRRWEAELKAREEEKKEERRRYEEELRRRDEDREKEERRREEERKAEKIRLEEEARLNREKFEKELAEQKRRFDEELKLRREEIRIDQERSKQHSVEAQKFQLELLNVFKNNKDSGLEMAAKIVDTMTNAGMSSMKTAQEAAETIMEVAKSASPGRKEKESGPGIGQTIKEFAQIAVPLIGPYIESDAKMRLLQAARASGLGLGARRSQRPAQPPADLSDVKIDPAMLQAAAQAMGQKIDPAMLQAAVQAFQQGVQAPPEPSPAAARTPESSETGFSDATAPATEETNKGSSTTSSYGGSGMIAQYLKAYPILKHALIGNLRDKLGVKLYIPIMTGLNQPTLEGLMANVPHQIVMNELKMVCTDDEQKLVDENEAWFIEFRKEMISILKESEGESEEDEVTKASAPPTGK